MSLSLKPFIAISAILLSPALLRADDEQPKWFDTTDGLEISGVHSASAGDYVTVSIAGDENRVYMAYNFDLILPAGVTFPETGTIGSPGQINPGHMVSSAVKDHGSRAKVICFSIMNEEFSAPVGSIADINLTVHPLAKAGDNEVEFREFVFNSKDPAIGFPIQWTPGNTMQNSATASISIPAERTVDINIPESERWATLILPFPLTELPDGVFAYRATSINDTHEVELEEVSALDPYKPYIIYAPQGWTETLSGIASADDFPTDAIANHGVLTANVNHHEREDGYLFSPHPENPTFTIVPESTHLDPGHIFISAIDKEFANGTPESLPIKILASVDIAEITDQAADFPIFNLLGERVFTPIPGNIYISRGHIFRK
ncbi:MAG: hypothetical protein HDR79_03740 [Bacteroides sp.]|nr:hypothetical protein [Bacteroides sp.]MBD5364045.1 hypothetical protein [Bacteroides sp.]